MPVHRKRDRAIIPSRRIGFLASPKISIHIDIIVSHSETYADFSRSIARRLLCRYSLEAYKRLFCVCERSVFLYDFS